MIEQNKMGIMKPADWQMGEKLFLKVVEDIGEEYPEGNDIDNRDIQVILLKHIGKRLQAAGDTLKVLRKERLKVSEEVVA